MLSKGDLYIDGAVFQASNVDVSTQKLNDILQKSTKTAPKWYEVGAAKYREMIYNGQTHFPVPPLLPNAKDVTIPSRESGRNIPVRVYKPDNGASSKGIFLYFHGGGFVIGSHKDQDGMLENVANNYQLTALSVGYRLAPENPFPAGIYDCFDVAEYLIDNDLEMFGAPLRIISGGSAGGNFAALTTFQLMRTRPQHRLDAVLLSNGIYDMTINMPATIQVKDSVVIDREMVEKFIEAYAPETSVEERRNPLMSPLYEDLQALAHESPFGMLPPVLITCGTADMMLDDSLLMGVKWLASGSEAILKLFPGAPHMFSAFKGFKVADEAAAASAAFLNEKLRD